MEKIPMKKKEKIELLRKADLFSRLMERDLEIIAEYSQYQHFKKGDVIFSEGNHNDGLFLVKDGEVLITKNKKDGGEINLARFISGESFGEMDLLRNASRNANAIADLDSTLLVFPKSGTFYKDVIQEHPEISARMLYKLLAIVAGRIRNTNKLISEKSPWIRDLRRQLFSDQLTGLYNRSFLEKDFATLLPNYGEATSLIMMKPDNFKEINDEFGHDAGDKVLRLMAIFIQSNLREDDIGIRYRGNELAAILPDTEMEEAIRIAEEIRSTVFEMDISHIIRDDIRVTVSIGISTYPFHADDNLKLIDVAYSKLFEARENGGNRILTA